jgi:hypothetical protein
MANRYWRIAANFHTIGDVVVTVPALNWQGAIRKAALAIKRLPELKGRRLKAASFMMQEVEAPVQATEASEQLPLPSEGQAQAAQVEQTPPATTSEPEGSS